MLEKANLVIRNTTDTGLGSVNERATPQVWGTVYFKHPDNVSVIGYKRLVACKPEIKVRRMDIELEAGSLLEYQLKATRFTSLSSQPCDNCQADYKALYTEFADTSGHHLFKIGIDYTRPNPLGGDRLPYQHTQLVYLPEERFGNPYLLGGLNRDELGAIAKKFAEASGLLSPDNKLTIAPVVDMDEKSFLTVCGPTRFISTDKYTTVDDFNRNGRDTIFQRHIFPSMGIIHRNRPPRH